MDYFGARMYDSDVARFLSLDPLQMKFADVSPYNYVLGNPARLVDPDGKAPQDPPSKSEMSLSDRILYTMAQSVVSWNDAMNNAQGTEKSFAQNVDKAAGDITNTILIFQSALEMTRVSSGSSRAAASDVEAGVSESRVAWAEAGVAAEEGYVFRGDKRGPDKIFAEGFSSKGNNMNLAEHAATNPSNSGYISTTTDPKVARSFAGENGYIYSIKKPSNGINVNGVLGKSSPFPSESEIAVPKYIDQNLIKGARKVGKGNKFTGPYIKKQ